MAVIGSLRLNEKDNMNSMQLSKNCCQYMADWFLIQYNCVCNAIVPHVVAQHSDAGVMYFQDWECTVAAWQCTAI